jgi:DNA-binding MarR family transcriptional regulator
MNKKDLIIKNGENAKDQPGISKNSLKTAIVSFENLEAIYHKISGHFWNFDVSKSRFLVMYKLFFASDQTLTSSDLADRLHISRSGMTRCLDGLEKVSYIACIPSLKDGRTRMIKITDAGRAYIEGELPRHYAFLSQIFSHLNRSEQKVLNDILDKLKECTDVLVRNVRS